MSGRAKSKKPQVSANQLANSKTAEQLAKMAKAAGVPQSKDGQKFTKIQLARRIVAKKS